MPLTYAGFYLGTGPLIDPTEGNTTAENAAALVGQTYGGVQDALVNNIVTITSQNIGGSATALDQNNSVANDQFVVDDGSGPVTYVFDAAAAYNITITYIDGSTANVVGVVFQSTTGALFLAPGPTPGGPYNAALVAGPIRSVTINSTQTVTTTGLGIDRTVLSFPTCFVAGTRIATARGPRAVERLRPGALVLTADRGLQPLRWIGHRRFSAAEAAANPALRAVRIAAGALEGGQPQRAIRLSRHHRLLVGAGAAGRQEGRSGVLVAAHHLVGLPGIELAEPEDVAFWHLMFDRHEIVFAEGAAAESLLPGPMALAALSPEARAEIAAILPGIARGVLPAAARPLAGGRMARSLAERMRWNRREPAEA